jgi:hypothetical protein
MPSVIEKRLERWMRKFVWDKKPYSPVSMDTLYAPLEEGGRNILDIQARNQAIQAMIVKEYLSFNDSRPMWAAFEDRVFAVRVLSADARIPIEIRRNILLQSWNMSKSTKVKMARDLRAILDYTKKMGVRLEGIAFEREILRQMPIFYHAEATTKARQLKHAETIACLRNKHGIWTVGEAERMAINLEKDTHKNNKHCRCEDCKLA